MAPTMQQLQGQQEAAGEVAATGVAVGLHPQSSLPHTLARCTDPSTVLLPV